MPLAEERRDLEQVTQTLYSLARNPEAPMREPTLDGPSPSLTIQFLEWILERPCAGALAST